VPSPAAIQPNHPRVIEAYLGEEYVHASPAAFDGIEVWPLLSRT